MFTISKLIILSYLPLAHYLQASLLHTALKEPQYISKSTATAPLSYQTVNAREEVKTKPPTYKNIGTSRWAKGNKLVCLAKYQTIQQMKCRVH